MIRGVSTSIDVTGPAPLETAPAPLEMRPRLGLPCPVELKKQVDFPEPRVRINTDLPDANSLGWDESAAWDDMARYYQRLQVP